MIPMATRPQSSLTRISKYVKWLTVGETLRLGVSGDGGVDVNSHSEDNFTRGKVVVVVLALRLEVPGVVVVRVSGCGAGVPE